MSYFRRIIASAAKPWIVTILLILAVLLSGHATVLGQTVDGDWQPPLNMSRSGGALNPTIFNDANGRTYIVWADTYAGFMVSYQDEELGWTAPKSVIFPFSPPRNVTIGPDYPTPIMMADARNRIHAFWIDGRGVLNHSSVYGLYFESPGSWSGKRVLAESAVAMNVTKDPNGNIHVAYIRNISSLYSPAGLYYRWLNTTSYYWTPPVLLEESPYFRSLEPENANVQIASSISDDAVRLMVGWDNRPRNRLSLIQSVDGGTTWGEMTVVEGPEVSTNPVIPLNLRMGSFGNYSILVWQEDEPGESCHQVYQYSNDGGQTWQGKQRMLTNLQGCADDYRFLIREDGQIILMTKILGQVYFQAWDGVRWSDPQLQTILSSFIDQETFNLVDLDCQFPYLTPENYLFVAGCDRGIGGDVWLTSRAIDTVSSWFPADTSWTYPINLASASMITLTDSVVADANGGIHAIWRQLENPRDEGAFLQYTRSDGQQWLPPQILFGPPVHYVGNTALATNGRSLYASWNDQSTGEIMITSAPVERASNPREWKTPVSLPLPRNDADTPALATGPDGKLYLAYAIPINEQRGIYLSISENDGVSWSEPILVFDAVAAGWPRVDTPKFTIDQNGQMHLIFSRYNNNNRSAGLYYLLSTDGGRQWSQADTVSEAGVVYSDIQVAGNGAVHVVWQENGSGYILWHAYFSRAEERWENRRSVLNSVARPELSPLLEDAAGEIHLLQLSNEGRGEVVLKHWLWNEPQWNVAEQYQIQVSSDKNASEVAAAITSTGQLVALYVLPVIDQRLNTETTTLLSVARTLDMEGSNSPAPSEPLVAVITEEPVEPVAQIEEAAIVENAPASPTVETAMIVDEPRTDLSDIPAESPNEWSGLAIGVLLGGVLTILILIIAVRSVRRRGLH